MPTRWFLRVFLVVGILVILAAFSITGSTGSRQERSTESGDDSTESTPQITLDSQIRHQTIDAWSVFAARYWQHDKKNNRYDRTYEQAVPAVTKFLVDDLGLNGVNVVLMSGFENPTDHWIRFYNGQDSYTKNKTFRYEKINDNDDPFNTNLNGFHFSRLDDRIEKTVLPFKREVEANGERLRVRAQYVDFKVGTSQGTLSHAKNPDEFAEFVLVGFQHLKNKYGIVPDSFEVVLEPENTVEWRGGQIGNGLVAAKKRLNQNGFFPEIVAPSVANLGNAASYFVRMIGVPGVSSAVTTVSYHRYGGESQENLKDVWDRARKHGMKTAMLEKGGAGFNRLWGDLTVANVSEWMQWAAGINIGDGSAGWYYAVVNMSNPQNPKVSPGRGYANLSQVFRYVRSGAVRIDANSNNAKYRAMAFYEQEWLLRDRYRCNGWWNSGGSWIAGRHLRRPVYRQKRARTTTVNSDRITKPVTQDRSAHCRSGNCIRNVVKWQEFLFSAQQSDLRISSANPWQLNRGAPDEFDTNSRSLCII